MLVLFCLFRIDRYARERYRQSLLKVIGSWSRVFESVKKCVANTKVDKNEIPVDNSKFPRAAFKVL